MDLFDFVVLIGICISKKIESNKSMSVSLVIMTLVLFQMLLFTHIRLAHSFSNYEKRLQCVQARLQAISILG